MSKTNPGKIFLLATQKGGAGKSGLTQQSALYCALELKKRTLLIDIEPQQNSTTLFGIAFDPAVKSATALFEGLCTPAVVRHESGIDVIAADDHLNGIPKDIKYIKNFILNVRELAKQYDAIFIDVPPSGEPLLTAAHAAATDVVGLASCDGQSLEGLKKFMATIEKFKTQVNPAMVTRGFVVNLYKPRRKNERALCEALYGTPAIAKALLCPPIQDFGWINDAIQAAKPVWVGTRDKTDKKAAGQVLAFLKKVYGVK